MVQITFILIVLCFSTLSSNACNLRDLRERNNNKHLSITGKIHKDVPCKKIQNRIVSLIAEEPESLQIQTQIQDLYYLDEYMISIQIQYIWIDNNRVGQAQVFSF